MTRWKRPPLSSLDGLGDEHELTSLDVSVIMQISPDKACDLLGRGVIAGMWRVGKNMRITAGDLRKYRESQRVGFHRSPLADMPERGRRRRAS